VTALEEIQAAVDKLTALKVASQPGTWIHQPYGDQNQNGDHCGGDIFDRNGEYLLMEVPDADGELIVTLHRTIDTQLAILRETLFQLSAAPEARGFIGNEFTLFRRLADAINGATS
jgi:hypothetical protein